MFISARWNWKTLFRPDELQRRFGNVCTEMAEIGTGAEFYFLTCYNIFVFLRESRHKDGKSYF